VATVATRGVTKSYAKTQVIHGIDLDIEDGEFVVLIGPSGCGKSTLLRMIAGLVEVTSGDIVMDGERVNELSPRDRDISMVFQNYALYPTKTVRQNMAFSLKLRGEDKTVMAEKVQAAAKLLSLEELLDRLPGQLSGGQRQRVAMGRAIVREPQLFLFDEPLSNLDAKLRARMRSEIKSLHQRINTTSIYVTHDQIEAMTLADRIVVLNAGRVEQIGTPMELFNNPVNEFVARFIGAPQINLIRGTVTEDEGQRFIEHATGRLPLDAHLRAEPGRKVNLGIRPEHLAIGGSGGMACNVRLIEPMGSETLVVGDVADQPLEIIIRDETIAIPNPGDTIHVAPMHNKQMLFDQADGRNLNA
jgi:multiple sugar transport system ATP-binding protein